ncbi:4-hydroxy-tetrahydrodipicolinate reductase [Mesonia hippocampi]|uniref:4-hydroxy-tetrahydrodipicolinate reductase n=1 Tax=Mesonia hippocampi TaxID=1628250 RepID=A0A840EXM6_9FLAO|nr:4-hydroxy-tetrahydrodipicolinate reductase [Mesonia hippocampi]MBB4119587.1 4-hydroxy-tetrahydrodipicolinate reductase [Mesonia hippocampi]
MQKLNIALLGYGRMGKAIEKIAISRSHTIVYKTSDTPELTELKKADIAIDFSIPTAAFENIKCCLEHNIPVISGTTGWLENYAEAEKICAKNQGSFLYASNFSLGVNLFFELNQKLAHFMQAFDNYNVSIEEIHHTKKLDKPSGTAISLAEGIINNHQSYDQWKLEEKNAVQNTNIPIIAKRIPDVPGTHHVKYTSNIDEIEIKHTAHSREGFALGAVVAAEYTYNKKGIFSMRDVLQIDKL